MSQTDPAELLHALKDIYNSRLLSGEYLTIVESRSLELIAIAITLGAALTLAVYDWILTFSDGGYYPFLPGTPRQKSHGVLALPTEFETIYQSRWTVPKALFFYVS